MTQAVRAAETDELEHEHAGRESRAHRQSKQTGMPAPDRSIRYAAAARQHEQDQQ